MYKNPHKDGIKSIDVPTTTYSKDDHWVKRSVLVSGLDLSTDSIDLSQAVNIVRQVRLYNFEKDHMVFRETGRQVVTYRV